MRFSIDTHLQARSKGLPGSEVTEHITTQVARSLGLLVAETEIRCFGGEHVLVVKQLDRQVHRRELLGCIRKTLHKPRGRHY